MIQRLFGFYFLLKIILLSSLMMLMGNCSFVSLIAAKAAAAWSPAEKGRLADRFATLRGFTQKEMNS